MMAGDAQMDLCDLERVMAAAAGEHARRAGRVADLAVPVEEVGGGAGAGTSVLRQAKVVGAGAELGALCDRVTLVLLGGDAEA